MRLFGWLKVFCILKQVNLTSAALFDHHEALGMACAVGAQELFTTCEQENYGCFCDSTLYVYAVENCIGREAHYNSTLMGMAFDKFNIKFCEMHNSNANTTNVWSSANQKVNPTVTRKAFRLAYEGEEHNASQKVISVWLGVGLILYWVAVVTLEIIIRVSHRIGIRLFTSHIIMRRSNSITMFFKKHMLWPALFGTKHMQRLEYFRGWIIFSIPTRWETLVVLMYTVVMLIFMLTPYTFMNNDPLFATRWKEMMRYGSDRAGIIATVQFPLFFLFAMRNNILIWLTGWSYSTFNTYHRAVARVTYLLLIIHAVMKHIFSASYGGSLVKFYYPVPYFRYGVAALCLFSLMVFSAIFRARVHELFYRLHQALALGGIICSIYHLRGIGFKTPLWIALAMWGTDWMLRILRILIFNVNLISSPLPGAQKTSFATARVYSGGEMIKLSITTPVRWICKPGQYVFIFTEKWNLIGGHPLSVVGTPKDSETGLEVVIKARQGSTRELFKRLDDRCCTPQYPVTIHVHVEGPYGVSAPVTDSEEGLFFAGGIGITGVLAYVEQMATLQSTTLVKRTVKLFWAIRDRSEIDPFAERLYNLNRLKNISIRIFQRSGSRAQNSHGIGVDYEMKTLSQSPNSDHNFCLANIEIQGDSLIDEMGASFRSTSPPRPPFRGPIIRDDFSLGSPRNFSWKKKDYTPRNETIGNGRSMRSNNVRKSFIELVKSGNPEREDQDYDYGKKNYIENFSHGHRIFPSTSYSDDTYVNESVFRNPPINNPNYESRRIDPAFVDAGFTDKIEERSPDTLNPFDNTLYRCSQFDDISDVLNDDDLDALTHEINGLVEPVGMDITELIRKHFKNSDGSLCVLGCGPDRMMDMLRWACCECLDQVKNGRVDYYEEAFSW